MYKHILVPVDGSKLSLKAVRTAASMAQLTKAKVTLFYAAPDFGGVYYMEAPLLSKHYTEPTFRAAVGTHAKAILDRAAKQAGIPVETRFLLGEFPYDGIVTTAAKYKCDLIVMASRGHRGLKGLLLGSETQKVLTHTKLPVLVVH